MGESRQAPGIVGIFLPFCYMHFFFSLRIYYNSVYRRGGLGLRDRKKVSLFHVFNAVFRVYIYIGGTRKGNQLFKRKKKKIRKNKTNVFSSPRIIIFFKLQKF